MIASLLAGITHLPKAATAESTAPESSKSKPQNLEIESQPPTRLILFATFLAQPAPSSSATTRAATLRDDPRYRRWQNAMTWGLVILITFVTAAAAIVVFSRRFRRWIGREKKKPTPSEDVWAMHKLPEDDPSNERPHDLN
jgi:hypothetical protein